MKVDLEPGAYVLAVSGGVDSMVLLDLLAKDKEFACIVAHFDHGIRPDAHLDAALVRRVAETHGLQFEMGEGKLGSGASEETARKARYEFLRRLRRKHHADALVTAHHEDDVIETAILNMLRGTGRKGLSSLGSTAEIKRPLLRYSKKQILAYARQHNIEWREDSTNTDTTYLRNYVRQHIMTKLDAEQRQAIVAVIESARDVNNRLDVELANYLPGQDGAMRRLNLIKLPHQVAKEVMAAWLRSYGLAEFDAVALDRLVVAAKTLKPGAQVDIYGGSFLRIGKQELHIHRPTR